MPASDACLLTSHELVAHRLCINFPYLVAILSSMRDDAQRQWLTWTFSLLALVVSAFSLLVSLSK